MKILFFTYDLPYPLTSGGKIRAYHLLKTLSKKHDVTLMSFYRIDSQLKYLEHLPFLSKTYTFKRRNLYSAGTLPHLFNFPFPAALYFDPNVKKQIKNIVKDSEFDVIHFESFYTTMFTDRSLGVPQIIGTENIEWHIYKQYLEQQPGIIQPFLRNEIGRIKTFEENTWKNADSCIAVSEENKTIIEEITGKKCEIIPNGVDIEMFKFKKPHFDKDTFHFLFIGSMQYIQNKDAAIWLISTIWPKIKEVLVKNHKQGVLSIAGPGTQQLSVADETVECLGEVVDIREVYNSHDVLLAPLRAGSGTKFKVLESAAVGNVVVTTDVGMEGLDGFESGKELLLANTPEEFVEQVEFILKNPKKASAIAERARDAVHKHHSWDYVGKKLLKYYETAFDHHR